ncbi:PstS family phosphate ABC transporter substrate-binding protein [Vibrio sp. UCD-FRSSP16_30]|uniref:PstS family phosphate ABC transporter substrate-binding protein n=1 Tax=unclassified Vibrio TaxID=2614977 RepID=UPI00359FAB51
MLFASFFSRSSSLPNYQVVQGISGNLSSVGSDSLAGIVSAWAEEFSTLYPSVNVQVQASGSSTAVPALTEGTAQFGSMSRKMQPGEIIAFEREYGYAPTELVVALDALGVFVHQDNPIKGLNFVELDAIFSVTYFCGMPRHIDTWSDLGILQPWGRLKIQKFGRNPVSGTYGVFKNKVLCGGDFDSSVNELLGATSVVQGVASSASSIGYSGVASKAIGTRLVPIAQYDDHYIFPTPKNIISGKYPLSRKLYLYVNKQPNRALPRKQREFIRYIYSKQGQNTVAREGYIPISSDFAKKELAKVDLKL